MKPSHILSALAGTYRFLNTTSTLPQPPNMFTIGLLTYTADGQVSVHLAADDPLYRPPTLTWPGPALNDTALDHDWAVAAKSMLSYAGPVTIGIGASAALPATMTSGEIRHGPLEICSIPGLIGTTLVRIYTVHDLRQRGGGGDGVYLDLAFTAPDGSATHVWWKKVE